MHRITHLSSASLILSLVPVVVCAANISYGSPDYTFSYPSTYQLKEYKSAQGSMFGQTIYNVDRDLPEGVLEIVTVPDDTDGTVTESAAIGIARRSCDADGPTASIHCTAITLSTPIRTAELQGYRLLLKEETKNLTTGAVSSRTRGPVYVLSKRVTHGTVMISYNHPKRPQRQHLRLVQQILRSFIGD